MTEPVVIKLEDPITNEKGEEITEITLRPPNLGDRQFLDDMGLSGDKKGKMDLGPWATTAFVAAQRLGNLAPATAQKISSADAMEIYKAAVVFIQGSRKTGETDGQS